MLARQRIADVDAVTHAEIDRDVGKQLKTGEAPAASFCEIDNSFSACAGDWRPMKAVFHPRAASENSFRVRRCNMPSVPSAPDEEVAQIVAGIVLLQLRQPVQNAPVGQHHFQPSAISRATP